MTHALLDGLRARFRLPTIPDVLAFHEAFRRPRCDLSAFFLSPDVVRQAIERVLRSAADSVMASVAMQFGQTTDRDGPLRSAIDTAGLMGRLRPSAPKRYDPAEPDPHELGTVLVSAVFEAFAVVFQRKTKRYRQMAGGSARARGQPWPRNSCRQAGELATQFLSICIRAIDYCPPIDLTFGEYLRALDHRGFRSRPR